MAAAQLPQRRRRFSIVSFPRRFLAPLWGGTLHRISPPLPTDASFIALYLKYAYAAYKQDGTPDGPPTKLLAAIGTFVDDVICAGPPDEQELFRKFIKLQFTVRDLGSPQDYLRMQVEHDTTANTIRLHQSKYEIHQENLRPVRCQRSRPPTGESYSAYDIW